MTKGRLEAFSDGVIAVIITIMVLELAVPDEPTWEALRHLTPKLLSYVLSFIFVGIYWSNHHHLIQITQHVDGRVLWANLHLLFWMSLIPFTTAWMGENHAASLPTAAYGAVLLASGIAYVILQGRIIKHHGPGSQLARAVGGDRKGKISAVGYAIGIPLAFVNSWIAIAIYVCIAAVWLIPDRRIEAVMKR